MDLKEALEAHAPRHAPCKLARIIDEMSDDDRDLFWQYSEIPGMSSRRLADALTESGTKISDDAVERHMNFIRKNKKKYCCCSRQGDN